MQEKNVDLETFLAELPSETAAKARAAAARIDELEHAATRIGASDQRYLVLFVITGVLALCAAVFTLGGFQFFDGGQAATLRIVMLVVAGAFPLLVLIYSFHMRERTRIDQQKFEIIETYFLPYGAIYLPPGPDREHGVVTISPTTKPWRKADIANKKRAGWYW